MQVTQKLVGTRCVLCGDRRSGLVVEGSDRLGLIPGLFRVVSCLSCGTWRLDPALPPGSLAELYPNDYDAHSRTAAPASAVIPGITHRLRRRFVEWATGGRQSVFSLPLSEVWNVVSARVFMRTKYGRFNPLAFPGEGKKLLDVGCATGDLLALYQTHGWVVTGIEPSAKAAQAARRRGLNAVEGNFPADAGRVSPQAPYSAVTMANVLEHLDDPLEALRAAFDLLEPGGLFLAWTPVVDGWLQRLAPEHWYNLDIPRHRYLFRRKGLLNLFGQAGFEVLGTWPGTSARAVLRSLSHWARPGAERAPGRRAEDNRAVLFVANVFVRILDALGRGDVMIVMAGRPGKAS